MKRAEGKTLSEKIENVFKSISRIDAEIEKLKNKKAVELSEFLAHNGTHWKGQILSIQFPNKQIPKRTIHITGINIGVNPLGEWDIFYTYKIANKDGGYPKNGKEYELWECTLEKSNVEMVFENLQEE